MRHALLAFFAFLAFAAPAMAQTPRMRGACTYVSIAGGAAFGGMDVQAASSGAGIVINAVLIGTSGGVYEARITGSTVLTASLATNTPLFTFGQGALTSVVREGTSPGGFGEGSFTFVGSSTTIDSLPPVFVPPGSFFTLQRTAAGTTLDATVCFTEVPS